ncbi:MAG: chorismate mutase [Candidatus Methanoplasma sp.]|jgi:prephenate dehydratase|nr:chorismate mutase [Candidatus Methanoplasma sp.]
MKIGYMGIPFSNSEEAAALFARRNRWNDVVLVPLMCAASVVKELENGNIDYGVVATCNIVAGPVIETADSLRGKDDIEMHQTIDVPIHHCLFVKEEGCSVETVASHIQALMQTDGNIGKMFPDAKRTEVEDTAYAAEMLADGSLPDNAGVVCRKDAGEHYGLYMLAENIEDDRDNMTSFSLLRLISR